MEDLQDLDIKCNVPCYRVILLGEPGVGMTTYTLRIKKGKFVNTVRDDSSSSQATTAVYQKVLEGDTIRVSNLVDLDLTKLDSSIKAHTSEKRFLRGLSVVNRSSYR